MLNRFIGLGVKNSSIAFRNSLSTLSKRQATFKGQLFRFNSTKANPNSTVSNDLKWDQFLSLRKQERRLNMYSSIVTAFFGAAGGWFYISQVELDSSLTLFGFDPLLVACVTLVATGGLGYLAGPLIGSAVFKAKNKSVLKAYQTKNSVFLKHIIKNRVDASRQSFSNPVPDFYGEKITSLKEYKQWLRDCNAYRRKVNDFV